jgi:hypothetical protein
VGQELAENGWVRFFQRKIGGKERVRPPVAERGTAEMFLLVLF